MKIENEFQYERTKHWLARFEHDIKAAKLGPSPENVHPEIHAAGIRGMESKADDLRQEIVEWETRNSTQAT